MRYTPYSFSKLNVFNTCPLLFKFKYIDKFKIDEEYTDPIYFIKGRFIHAYIANRLNGGDGFLFGYDDIEPTEKINLIENVENVFNDPIIKETFEADIHGVEHYISFDTSFIASTQKTKLMSGVIDYYAVDDDYAIIIDWKSGKYRKNQSFDQLMLYAIWLTQQYKSIKEISLVYYFVETQQLISKTVSIDELITYREYLFKTICSIEENTLWSANIGHHCNYCPYKEQCKRYNI